MTYKIKWLDATECRQPSQVFPNWKLEKDDGVWKDCLCWSFFDSDGKDLRYDVQKHMETLRQIDVFSVTKKYGRKVLLTEENL